MRVSSISRFIRRPVGRRSALAVLAAATILMALTLGLRTTGAAAAPGPQKWALLVGVDRYETDQISPLRCAAADAHALEAALVEVAGFPREHVIVMTSDGPASEKPSAENVLERLAGFQAACQPGDEFVFFFSGHGMEQDGESYLLTCNAKIGSNASLKKSCLAVKEVQAAIREVRAARILQLVDACRNDPRSGRGAADNRLTSNFSKDLVLATRGAGTAEAAVTLFSCKVGQRSYEGYKDHGYFTYFLVAGLRGEAAAADGTVTLPGLVTYLESRVPDAVRLNQAGKEQTPWADISGTGSMSWVLARPGKSGVALQPVRPAVTVPAVQPQTARPPAPQPTAAPRPATPPKVTVTSPAAGTRTTRERVVVAATITGGGGLADVTVSVNGQDVPLGGGLKKSAGAAMVNVAVPLEPGENTIVVAAMSASGQPAQAAVTVQRNEPAPVAAPAPATASAPAAARPTNGGKHPSKPAVKPAASRPAQVAANTSRPSTPSSSGEGSEMIRIPGGTFTMGSTEDSDKPPHQVTVSSFLIGKYPVTNAQFQRFVDATGYKTEAEREGSAAGWTGTKWDKIQGASWRAPRGPGSSAEPRHPVVSVSWNDANKYCEWGHVRLLTEEEWEYAARGTDGRRYPWGNDWDPSRCRNNVDKSDGSGGTAPVGSFPSGASPFGCLDMAGNVWQWTSSLYKTGEAGFVLRGGSWANDNAAHFRATLRNRNLPTNTLTDYGLRVARTN